MNPNYTLTSVPAWQDGSTVDSEGNPVDTQVGLKGHSPNWSLYFADTLTLALNPLPTSMSCIRAKLILEPRIQA